MHTYSPIAVVLMMLVVAAIMWWGGKYNGRAILQRQFKATFDPGGPYTECDVRFVTDDMPAPCVVRATREGWYMVTPESMRKRPNWSNNVALLKRPVFIPWESLDYYRAKFPMGDWIRFDVKRTRATFFVRRDVTMPLLQAGGRPPPRESK
jgi:hypothetical protein